MTTPKAASFSTSGVQSFRERVLNVLLGAALVAALPVLVVNVIPSLRQQHYATAFVYISAFLLLGFLFFLKRYPRAYTWRVWGLMLVLYGVTTTAYLATGVAGDGRVWLLGIVALGMLLLPEPHNFINFFAAILYHFGMGFAFLHHWLAAPISEYLVHSQSLPGWTRTGITLAGVAVAIGVAVMLYRRNLENTLEESQTLNTILEQERSRLKEQSTALERRVTQIRTASEISRVAATILDPDELIERVVNLVRDRFELYYVGIFLVDERGEYAVLRAGTGEAGQKMLAEGHRLAIGGASMIGWSISNRKPRIAMDVGEDAVRFANPHLPLTRTELALPLISHGEVLGAMTVQSERPQAFDEDDLAVLQSVVDLVATALYNARLYQQTQRGLQTLAETRRQVLAEAWQMTAPPSIEVSIGDANPAAAPENEGESTYTLQVPITLYGQPLGEITLESDRPWEETDRQFAAEASAQLAVAVESLYLTQQAQHAAAESRMLTDISDRISTTLDLDTVIQTALRELRRVLNVTEAEIHLTAPEAME